MADEPERKSEKGEESEKLKKSPEYRRFKRLLKQVISAPPMRRSVSSKEHQVVPGPEGDQQS